MRNGPESERRRCLDVLAVAALCLVLLGSATAGDKKKQERKPAPVDITKLAWPPPPQEPRVRFAMQATGETDLSGKKKKSGWLERVAGVSIEESERAKLGKPYGVAVDSKGLVYVADTALRAIFIFDLEKKEIRLLGDRPPARLSVPIGVAIDKDDRLFVSDSTLNVITCFNPAGEVVSVFGEDILKGPAGIAVDNELRRLYVAEPKQARVAIFDLDRFTLAGEWKSRQATERDPVNVLGTPTNLAVDADGLVYVVDTIPNMVEIFDPEGNLVRYFGEQGDRPGKFMRPKGIAVDRDGHIYVADAQFNNIQVFTPLGQPLMAIGRFGFDPGQFGLVTGLAMDHLNRLVVTDQMPARIQVLRYVTDAEAAAAQKPVGPATPSQAGPAKPEEKGSRPQ